MGDTIEDMDIEKERKNEKVGIFEKIGVPDSKFIEEMNKLGLGKLSSKTSGDSKMARLNVSPNTIKTENNKTKFLNKCFALIMTGL